ncbi:hypothetical protein [Streptomyces sp. NPDC056399]|uniref:hypothetical protein n=1 Tax=Streptomyces sp. NPDC056399 TaxID=3345807 RepID=UPI0035D9FE18
MTDPQLCWPPALRQPANAPQQLVYLDLCHWINLAKAAKGLATGTAYRAALEACRAAVRDQRGLFVLSPELYRELGQVEDPKQRQDVTSVMEELTGYASLPPRSAVLEREIDAALTSLFGPSAAPPAPMSLVEIGFGHALGMPGKLSVRGPRSTAELEEQIGAAKFRALMSGLQGEAERRMLAGPDDDEAAKLAAQGHDLKSLEVQQEQRAEFERVLQGWLRENPNRFRRQSELRNVIAGRELIVGFFDLLLAQLIARGLAPDAVDKDIATLNAFVLSMPSMRVTTVLKARMHSNRSKKWLPNDIYDIDAMSLAVPYCDIVAPDKEYANALHQAHLSTTMHTTVVRNLGQLADALVQPRIPHRRSGR